MSSIKKMRDKWQGQVRVQGHPCIYKSFISKTDARRWATETELRLRREDAGIAKVKFPQFRDIALRYLNEVSVSKKSFKKERSLINVILKESFAEYALNKISPTIVAKFRDNKLKEISGTSVNRYLDVISTIFTQVRKEWGYALKNPVLSIRRPKKSEPRNRRFTDDELNKLIKGNHTCETMRTIIQIALSTGMRCGEILRARPEHIKGKTLLIPIAKTEPRTIPLTREALSYLKNADLPFNVNGDWVTKRFNRLCKTYKIKDAVFHDLRHQSLSDFMLYKKLNVADTMLISGHKDPRMLLRVYNNIKVDQVAKKLD
jgi:integrase|tara:strand:+ start:845 stop:1795 length:951 start_codon:yes stop_codon:yes gene_type:complete